jgi:drug/metabolite transporter (DMT)-like permease
MSGQGLVYLFATLVLSLYGQLALKWRVVEIGKGAADQGPIIFVLSMLLDVWVLTALASCGLGLLAWMRALNDVPLARGYAFLALLYVLVPICTWWLFDERLAPLQIGGIGLIVTGVILVALGTST